MKNRKKMAGTIAMIMALSLGYNAGGPVVVHAHENAVITEKLGETAASQEGVIDFSAIKDNEDLEVADYLPSDINDMEKICTEDYSVNLVDMADNTEDNKTVNDNPNDAKAISLGTQVYDTVATELEQRWYAFSVAKATKFTAAMVMDDTADFDLYVYKLNETDGAIGYKISIGGCTSSVSSKRYFYNEFYDQWVATKSTYSYSLPVTNSSLLDQVWGAKIVSTSSSSKTFSPTMTIRYVAPDLP